MIKETTNKISQGNNLTAGEMVGVMREIMSGKALTEEIAPFLIALTKKGETVEELTAAVKIMREYAVKINSKQKIILDTCGTGGDKKGTFNISTAVAFVASGAGAIVAKHGNRSVSSRSGSADILEALGVDINLSVERIEKCLGEVGIAFLFAQNLHPAMKFASAARKQIADRTIFNILGPLSNPAGAGHQLIGVFDERLTAQLAEVLANLGTQHALVVHGQDGLDEITTTSQTYISEVKGGKIDNYKINPEDFGLKRAKPEDLLGGDPRQNAKDLLEILNGKTGPKRDIIILNAAAAIYAADKAVSIKEGLAWAEDSIDSGRALKKLEELKKYSRE
ncbi:MAG: anthranilate phosphoribosyltransferase [Candidatus Omnitrophota bacterium]